MPLVEGVQVATADDGRAEIQFEDGSVARISPNSSLTLTVLRGQGGTEMVLNSGLGYFELQNGSTRVRFGDSMATAGGFTVLRISMDKPPGELAVFSGNAHVVRGDALALDLHGGESVALNDTDPSQYSLAESIEPDSWDAWNSDRDQALSSESAERTDATNSYDNSDTPQWNDLDANGNWYNVPGDGYVWSPYEASNTGWDPYGCGSWRWTPGFGYVWVSCESWGYLPYQCGAWNYYDGFGWGWVPGMMGGYRGVNIRNGPPGYRRVERPGWRRPIGRGAPPVIAVNRNTFNGAGGLPLRERNTPVTIAGSAVLPMHALAPRPQYDRLASGFVNHSAPVYNGNRTSTGTAMPAYVGPTYTRRAPVTSQPAGPVYRAPAYGNTRSPSYSSPGRSYSPPPSRPSGGGSYGGNSGGGGGHPSGGGGGGGGHH
jgi:hypothetical protein